MTIFDEIEKVIAELPKEQVVSLKLWLTEFQSAHRYKKLKSYAVAFKALEDFKKGNDRATWN